MVETRFKNLNFVSMAMRRPEGSDVICPLESLWVYNDGNKINRRQKHLGDF